MRLALPLIVFLSSPLAAESPPVEITVVGSEGDLARVRALLPPRPITWSRRPTFDAADLLRPSPSLRAFIDLRIPTHARLYFSSPSSSPFPPIPDRYLVRDVPLSGRFDEVDRATLTEILELSLSALRADNQAGLSRQETEALLGAAPPRPPPAPPPASRPPPAPPRLLAPASPLADAPVLVANPYRFTFAATYALHAVTDGAPLAHGPGLLLFFARKSARPTFAPWIAGQYRFTEPVHLGPIGVELDTLALRAGAELRWGGLAAPFALRLGTGADLVHVSPRASSPDILPTASRWTTELAFAAAFRAGRRIGGGSALSALALVDVVPAAARYELETGGGTVTVFAPWRVRPGLALELSFR